MSIFRKRFYMIALLVLLSVSVALAGCSSQPAQEPETNESTDSDSTEGRQPTESVGMNVEYEVVDQDLHLQFQLTNMELNLEQLAKENESGQGHVHLYLNDEKVESIFEPDFVWEGLDPGEYNVRVELAHNNHEPYGIEEEFVIRVEEPTDSDVSN